RFADVRRKEEILGIGFQQNLLRAFRHVAPQRVTQIAVMVLGIHYEHAIQYEKRRFAVRRPLFDVVERETELSNAIERDHFFAASFAFASCTITSTSCRSFLASYRMPSFITYLMPPMRSACPVVSFT